MQLVQTMLYALTIAAAATCAASWLCFESPVDRVLGVMLAVSWLTLLVLL